MSVAILCTNDLTMSPYVWFYADLCKKNNINYVVITKANQKISIKDYNIVTYVMDDVKMSKNRAARVLDWFRWLRKFGKKNNITKYIVTPTNTAVLLAPFLLFNKNKYIFDIRDYTKENLKWYRAIEKKIIKKAEMVIISSEGFLKWVCKTKTPIYAVHNMPVDSEEVFENYRANFSLAPKTLGYIGYVNYYEINKRLIDVLRNGEKYRLRYVGKIASSCRLEAYANEKGSDNIDFSGEFQNDEKPFLYRTVDMINAIYGNDSLIVTTALPNKLYDAILYKKPILAAEGTFLGETVEKAGIGMAIDVFHEDVESKLDEYWAQFDADIFLQNCTSFYRSVKIQQEDTIKHILSFLKA